MESSKDLMLIETMVKIAAINKLLVKKAIITDEELINEMTLISKELVEQMKLISTNKIADDTKN